MFLSLIRGFLRLFALAVVVTSGWMGFARASQKALPILLYSENFTLYRVRAGCASLLQACTIEGERVVDTLYSIPVTVASSDGRQIAVHLSEQWGIYDSVCLLEQTECQPRLLDPKVEDTRIAWGPDGSLIAYVDNSGTVMHLLTRGCWELEAGRCLRQIVSMSEKGRLGQISWSADGQRMIFVDGQSARFALFDMKCLDDSTGCAAYYHIIRGNYPSIALPSLSTDGTQALFHADTSRVGIGEQLFILDTETGETRQITFRSGASLHPAWSADRRYVAYVGFATPESGDLELFVMDLQRGLTTPLLHHEGRNIDYPTWGIAPKNDP